MQKEFNTTDRHRGSCPFKSIFIFKSFFFFFFFFGGAFLGRLGPTIYMKTCSADGDKRIQLQSAGPKAKEIGRNSPQDSASIQSCRLVFSYSKGPFTSIRLVTLAFCLSFRFLFDHSFDQRTEPFSPFFHYLFLLFWGAATAHPAASFLPEMCVTRAQEF